MDAGKHSDVSESVLNTDEGAAVDRRELVAAMLSQAAIAERAYEIFVQRGRVEDQCEAHWLEAQRQLIDEALEAEVKSAVIVG